MTPAGRASWKSSFPDQLLITTARDEYLPLTVPSPGPRPTPALLQGTGWYVYPGAEWHELLPGQWTAPVFPLPSQRAASGR